MSSTGSHCRTRIRSGGSRTCLRRPHIGYVTRETYAIYYADAVECLSAWLDGSPIRVLNGN